MQSDKLKTTDPRECAHGVGLYDDPPSRCVRCELVWYRDCLADATRRVASCGEMIRKLERELESTNAD